MAHTGLAVRLQSSPAASFRSRSAMRGVGTP